MQWQELSAELEEHQKENLALCDKIKRSRQAITAEIIEQRRMKRSFHNASAQLNKRIRYSSCSYSSKCMRKVVLFVTRSSEGHPTASGQWLSIQQHVPVISASPSIPMLQQGNINAQDCSPLAAARSTSTHALPHFI